MNSRTERRQEADPPIAELVAEALDDDPLVRRQGARRLALVLEIGEKVLRREIVEVVALRESGQSGFSAALPPPDVGLELTDERAERTTQFDRSAHRVAVPERQL